MDLMKKIIAYLLLAIVAVGQTTYNNLAVKTNLTVSGVQVAAKVNTVADLVAMTPTQNGMLVQTLGRNSAGDGGGARFRWVSGSTVATNLGTVFAPSSGSGRFEWVQDGPLVPEMFGAVGYENIYRNPYYNQTNISSLTDFSVWVKAKWPTFSSSVVGNGLFRLNDGTNSGSLVRAVEVYGTANFFAVGIRGTNGLNSPTTTASDAGYLLWTPNPFLGLSGTTNDFVLTRTGTNWAVYVNATNYTSSATVVNAPGLAANPASGANLTFSEGVVSTAFWWNEPVYNASVFSRVLSGGEISNPSSATNALANISSPVFSLTDSGEAIQSAIDYASGNIGIVTFPAKSYFTDREIIWKYGVELTGTSSDYTEANVIASGSRIFNMATTTNRAVLTASGDYLNSAILLDPRDWVDGTYGYNRELQGKMTGMWLDSLGSSDAIWLDKVACVKLSRVTLSTYSGYLARLDAGNVIEFDSVSAFAVSQTRPMRFYNTADTIFRGLSFGGVGGQNILLASGNKNLITSSFVFNSGASPDKWVPTVSTNTGLFTRSGHSLIRGQSVWLEADIGGVPPEPFASAYTPATNGSVVYWGPVYAVPVTATTFGLNTRYSTNSAGSAAAMQGTYQNATSVGSGTWRLSSGPEANITIWQSSGNVITSSRLDQSYADAIVSYGGYANLFNGNNLAEAGFGGSSSATGVRLLNENGSIISANTFGKIRTGSSGDFGVVLASGSTNISVDQNTYYSISNPVSIESGSFEANKNANSVTNSSGDVVFQRFSSSLASSTTNGFAYLPELNGNPSGTPGVYTGNKPVVPVPSTRRLYTHSGSAWLYAPLINTASANTFDISTGNVITMANGSSTALTTSGSAIQIALTTTGTETITAQGSSDTSGASPSISFYRTRGTPSAPTQVTDGTELWDIIGSARDNAGGWQFNLARIRAVATDDVTSTAKGGAIEIRTTLDGSTSEAGRVFVGGVNGAVQIAPAGISTPATSAALDVSSTTLGFLPPRMTTVQRDAISSPAEGLVIFNTTDTKLQVRAGAAWVNLH
jgi:hypothetical protein